MTLIHGGTDKFATGATDRRLYNHKLQANQFDPNDGGPASIPEAIIVCTPVGKAYMSALRCISHQQKKNS